METDPQSQCTIDRIAEDVRRRLPLLQAGVAFNHAGISPQPLSEGIAAFEEARARLLPGEVLTAHAGIKREIRTLYAELLGVTPEEIAITRHTAEGVNLIAQGFPWREGDRILTVNVEYPSNVYPWWNLKERGIEVVAVPERDGRVDLEEFIGAIDERVRLVAISHVEFASGFTFDLECISAACRVRGIFLFVDVAQSIGLLPVCLSLADAAAWPTWKWLMGPIGMGGFYLASRWLPVIRPLFVGTDGMMATPDYLDYRFEFRPDASRFEYSTENMLGLIGTAEALRRVAALFAELAQESVAHRVWRFGDELAEALQARGFALCSSFRAGERSGIFSFRVPGRPEEMVSGLRRHGVEAAVRGGRLRLSPHFYNNRADLERLLTVLDAML